MKARYVKPKRRHSITSKHQNFYNSSVNETFFALRNQWYKVCIIVPEGLTSGWFSSITSIGIENDHHFKVEIAISAKKKMQLRFIVIYRSFKFLSIPYVRLPKVLLLMALDQKNFACAWCSGNVGPNVYHAILNSVYFYNKKSNGNTNATRNDRKR